MSDEFFIRIIKTCVALMMVGFTVIIMLLAADSVWRLLFK